MKPATTSRTHLQAFVMILAIAMFSTNSAIAETPLSDNHAPATTSAPAAPAVTASPTKAPAAELPSAPSAELQASLSVNPFSNAALSSDSPAGQTGNSLTSTPTHAKSSHHALALAGGIAGTALAGFGTFLLVADAGCKANCPARTLGAVTLPIGAAVAVAGYYFAFHHKD